MKNNLKRDIMKLILIILMLFNLAFFVDSSSLSSCTVKTTCVAGEMEIVKVYDNADSHIYVGDERICCSASNLSLQQRLSSNCPFGTESLFKFYHQVDSHVSKPSVTSVPNNNLCLKTTDASDVQCQFRDNSCNVQETCVLSLYQDADSHVGDCSCACSESFDFSYK